MRKHSVIARPPVLCISPDSRSIALHARWRLASGDGGASATFGATLDDTAWITGSKIGTATWPPVAPPPSVRRMRSALSYPILHATVTTLVVQRIAECYYS